MAYTKLPSELSALVGDGVEGPVEVLVRKRRRVVLRRVRWMWIVVCGFAGRGMESWRGWMVVGMSLFGVLVAMVGAVPVWLLCAVQGRWWGALCLAQGCGRIKVLPRRAWFW